ncbi:unnamed protein product [Miscanthus lutarioriparius]|uniref:Uncharacterized protein n=1 Tax=Miscanthus lutarioriparius TaxID=422564 RepID=A0A811QW13_9POAL|nr:unnamed protein product [Miscanthus lutarioriparius]
MSIPRAAHLLVLLSVLAAISLSCGAAAALPVYDTDGHELSADADYYVLPAPRGSGGGGGGLTMAPNGLRCPLFVAQETDPLRKGFPVRFTPLPQQDQGGNANDRTVRVNSDVGVHFAAVTTCVQTTEWHVSGDGDAPAPLLPSGRRRLVLTGPARSPSPNGREKVFRVEKHSRGGYKLVWCGAAGSGSTSSCQDLGVVRDDGDRRAWLGTAETDRAHVVVFEKAATVHA